MADVIAQCGRTVKDRAGAGVPARKRKQSGTGPVKPLCEFAALFAKKRKSGAGSGVRKAHLFTLDAASGFCYASGREASFGHASHHALHGVRPAHFCRAGGLGNAPTSRKGYSFPLLAKKVVDIPFSFDCPKIQYFRCIINSSNTGEQTHTCATAFLLCYPASCR